MRKYLLSLFIFFITKPLHTNAQFENFKDSVVQLYGIVMTADSLKGLEGVSIEVKGQNRGTISNDKGIFSIVVLKGDEIEFTSTGYKAKYFSIPKNLNTNQQSLIQLMVTDTVFLPATIIRARPTKEQFERDFLNTLVPDDNIAIARKNNDNATRRILMSTLPSDGREAGNTYLRKEAAKAYYSGQLPPQNIFNPFAWVEFIKAWKRGDYKRKQNLPATNNYHSSNPASLLNSIYKPSN